MKIKKTVITDTAKAHSANAVLKTTGNIQNCSGMTEAEQVGTKAHTITVPINDFNDHGNTIRTAIDYGDDHTQITKNTYVFDNAAIGYLGRLFKLQMRTAAPQKTAQDKTTVCKSEFTFHSDGLFLSETVQPDNVPAVATTHFTYNAIGRVIREGQPDGTRLTTKYDYDDSQNVTNPRNGLSATSMYHMANSGSVASLFTTRYDRIGQAFRARTVGFNSRMTSCPAGNGLHISNVFDANRTRDRIYVTPTSGGGNLFDHRYKFNSISAVTRCTDEPKNFAKNITYDHLDRLTDENLAGASTVAASCDDLGTITNRTKNPGLGDVSAYLFSGNASVLVGMAEPMSIPLTSS